MPTTMHSELSIYADDLDPQRVTDLLGMPPDKAWRRGDPKTSRGHGVRNEGCWKIVTAPSENQSESLDDHFRALLGRIAGVRDRITLLGKDCSVEFACVLKVDADVPALHIEADTIQAIAAMKGCIDYDVYL